MFIPCFGGIAEGENIAFLLKKEGASVCRIYGVEYTALHMPKTVISNSFRFSLRFIPVLGNIIENDGVAGAQSVLGGGNGRGLTVNGIHPSAGTAALFFI